MQDVAPRCTGDEEADLARSLSFYAGRHGKHPERETPIRFAPALAGASEGVVGVGPTSREPRLEATQGGTAGEERSAG